TLKVVRDVYHLLPLVLSSFVPFNAWRDCSAYH
ncbi:hypothetical protein LSAT2_025996, partial [Lamellibrachia satsuma]